MNPTLQRFRKYATLLSRWCSDDWEAKVVALVLAVVVWWGVKVLIKNDAIEKGRISVPHGYSMEKHGAER